MVHAFSLMICLIAGTPNSSEAEVPENLVIVTVDGLRWQELFTGVDPTLMRRRDAGVKRQADHTLMAGLWDESPAVRRSRLFPYFWGSLVQEGQLWGNRLLGSRVDSKNRVLKSFAGYAEILTGRSWDRIITDNRVRPMPGPTLLEVLQNAKGLGREEVALFASWARFQSIAAQEPNSFVVNAGFQALTELSGNKQVQSLNRRQLEQLTPWTEVRHDFITCELALEFLRAKNPSVLYLGLGETDDWAHDGRYPRVVWAASYFDRCLREFVTYIDTHPKYKGKTLLVITTDHGRGRTVDDWTKHSRKVAGSEETWIFMRGPGIAQLGEHRETKTLTLSDLAPTILKQMGYPSTMLPGTVGRSFLP